MKKTRVCDMLGIEYPIFQGGMALISDAFWPEPSAMRAGWALSPL